MNKEAFSRGFIKAAMANGLNLETSIGLLKQADPTSAAIAIASLLGARAWGDRAPAPGSVPGPADPVNAGLSGLGGNLGAVMHGASVNRRNNHGKNPEHPSAVNRQFVGSALGQLLGGGLGAGAGYGIGEAVGSPEVGLPVGLLAGALGGSGIGSYLGARSYNKAMKEQKAKGFNKKD